MLTRSGKVKKMRVILKKNTAIFCKPTYAALRDTAKKSILMIVASIFSFNSDMLTSVAHAQTPGYPSKTLTMIVPFAAGGPADLVGREVARLLSEQLGKPVVVENQGGASGTVALNTMARAAPDGHTMLLAASGTVVIHPLLVGKFDSVVQALAPVSLVSTSPHVLVVTDKIPVRSVQQLIDYARANPGKLNFGSSGTGGAAHLGMELFKSQAHIDAVHVPYKGTSQVLTDLVSGEVQALFSSMPSLQSLIDKGSIRAIGMTGPNAAAQAAGIPEISKSGLPGFGYTTWYAMFVPSATPASVIASLNASLNKVLNNQSLQQKLAPQGLELHGSTPEALSSLMQSEAVSWQAILKSANIKSD